jgi:DNA polymerase-3 subunit delta'
MNGSGLDIPPPRANPDLVGHEAAERTLRQAFESGRLAHAWLICGPRGIGKATLAFRFARYVLAQGRTAAGQGGLFDALSLPAGDEGLYVPPESPIFRRVAAGGHADLVTVERAYDEKRGRLRTEIVVDDVRGIGAFFAMTAAESGFRVVIVDSADEMNRNAANALLKILEEPPRRSLLLLVAHSPGQLLPTIRSRCRRLNLKPLPGETVTELVRRYVPAVKATEARTLARLAEGSVGRALALAEEGGVDLYDRAMGLIGALPTLDVRALHQLADQVTRPGGDAAFQTLLDLIRAWLVRLIRHGAGEPAAEDVVEAALNERLLAGRGLDRWLEVWEKIDRLLARAVGADLDRRQVILSAFLALEGAARP